MPQYGDMQDDALYRGSQLIYHSYPERPDTPTAANLMFLT